MAKVCSKCGIEKEYEDFRKLKSGSHCCWCISCEKQYKKEHYQRNKERIDSKNKKYVKNHKIKILEYHKKYYQDNKEILSEKQKEYIETHREEIREKKQAYDTRKRETDPLHKMKQNIRSCIRMSLKKTGYSKNSHSYEILECSYEDICKYLFETAKLRYPDFQERDFLEKNKYHIDHIIPLALAKTEEEVLKLCRYTNLQLLTKEDNLEKLDRIDWK